MVCRIEKREGVAHVFRKILGFSFVNTINIHVSHVVLFCYVRVRRKGEDRVEEGLIIRVYDSGAQSSRQQGSPRGTDCRAVTERAENWSDMHSRGRKNEARVFLKQNNIEKSFCHKDDVGLLSNLRCVVFSKLERASCLLSMHTVPRHDTPDSLQCHISVPQVSPSPTFFRSSYSRSCEALSVFHLPMRRKRLHPLEGGARFCLTVACFYGCVWCMGWGVMLHQIPDRYWAIGEDSETTYGSRVKCE